MPFDGIHYFLRSRIYKSIYSVSSASNEELVLVRKIIEEYIRDGQSDECQMMETRPPSCVSSVVFAELRNLNVFEEVSEMTERVGARLFGRDCVLKPPGPSCFRLSKPDLRCPGIETEFLKSLCHVVERM